MTTEGVLPVPGTGELLDTTVVTQENGESQAHREVVVLADPDDAAARAGVTNATPSSTDYGSLIRQIEHPASRGAFGWLRVSAPTTLFDSKQLFDNAPLYWDDQEVSGSGTTSVHSALKASSTLGVALNTAGKRVRQTFQSFNYQPGKSQLVMMTGNMGDSGGGSGIDAGMGLYNGTDGVAVRSVDGVLQLFVSSGVSGSVVEDSVSQGSFNGDNLDGTGPSGLTLDPTQTQIWWMDMEWLGVGTVRTGFVINGEFILCHSFHHANLVGNVYMSTPNLPLRYWLENDGTGAATTLQHICSTVISEGGVERIGNLHYHSTEGTHINADTANTLYAVVGIRLQAAKIGQVVDLTNISLINAAADDFEWIVMWNPTVAGTFTYTDHVNSAIQTAVGATANTVTGGHEMNGGFVKAGNTTGSVSVEISNALRLGAAIDGTLDEIVLCVRPLTNGADIDGGVSWRELT